MTDWAPRIALETVLGEIDAALVRAPDAIETLFARASILVQLGRIAEAQASYRAVLARDPNHLAALSKLGVLVRKAGDWREAHLLFERAVRAHPQDAGARVNLANSLALADPDESRRHYETALQLAPNLAEAHEGLSSLLELLGDDEGAARHRIAGFGGRSIRTLPYVGRQAPITAVLLNATVGGNIDASLLLDDATFLTFQVFADVHDLAVPLPAHRLVLNGVADADRAAAALACAEAMLREVTAPVINRPSAVRQTSRLAIAQRFAGMPGVVTPKVRHFPRRALEENAEGLLRDEGFAYPVLLRTPGHHIGQHFHKVDSPEGLRDALRALPGKTVYAIEYLDTRLPDGNFRKYRVMVIGGALYPAHLAISKHWKVHYFSSGMADSEAHRREEAQFLEAMPNTLGARAMDALRTIASALELEYAGIDFALGAEGDVVLFEANAAMTVYAPPADEKWAYRAASVQRMRDALKELVLGYCTPAT